MSRPDALAVRELAADGFTPLAPLAFAMDRRRHAIPVAIPPPTPPSLLVADVGVLEHGLGSATTDDVSDQFPCQ